MFEQKAFEFFENNIDSFTFYYGEKGVRFNPKVNYVVLTPSTFCFKGMTMELHRFKHLETNRRFKKEKFLDYSGDSLYYQKRIHCDTNSIKLIGHKLFVKVGKSNEDNIFINDADLNVSVSNHFAYKDFCYVRIIVHVKEKMYSHEIWVKLDRKGNIIDYIQESGVN
jgi:hypothetical protein